MNKQSSKKSLLNASFTATKRSKKEDSSSESRLDDKETITTAEKPTNVIANLNNLVDKKNINHKEELKLALNKLYNLDMKAFKQVYYSFQGLTAKGRNSKKQYCMDIVHSFTYLDKDLEKIKLKNLNQIIRDSDLIVPKYADPTYDVIFKQIFNDSKNLTPLTNLIESILRIKISNPQLDVQEMTSVNETKCIFDLRCTIENEKGRKETAIIEIQRSLNKHFFERIQYYGSKLYVNEFSNIFGLHKIEKSKISQKKNESPCLKNDNKSENLTEDDNKSNVSKVIIICFTKDTVYKNKKEFYHEFKLRTEEGTELPYNKLEYHFFELTKFEKMHESKSKTKEEYVLTDLEEWLYFLGIAYSDYEIPNFIKNPIIINCYDKLEEIQDKINFEKNAQKEFQLAKDYFKKKESEKLVNDYLKLKEDFDKKEEELTQKEEELTQKEKEIDSLKKILFEKNLKKTDTKPTSSSVIVQTTKQNIEKFEMIKKSYNKKTAKK